MEIKVTQEKGRRPVTVMHVTGSVDSSNYQQFEQSAREAFEGGAKDILVNLADCDYVSSAGIRALNSILMMLRTDAAEESSEAMNKGIRDGTWKSPHLKLLNVSKRVEEVLRIAGIDMLIESHTDLKKAVDSF